MLQTNGSNYYPAPRMRSGRGKVIALGLVSGVHNAKAEECTTPRIGSRNIEIKIGVGGLPRNQK